MSQTFKLWVDKTQTKAHVRVVFGDKVPDRDKVVACFISTRRHRNGYFGTVYLRRKATWPTVIHELTHVAMHFVQFFTDMRRYNKLSDTAQYDYMCEATAYAMGNLVEQYILYDSKRPIIVRRKAVIVR